MTVKAMIKLRIKTLIKVINNSDNDIVTVK